MTINGKYKFKQILSTTLWILLGAGTIVLLVAAVAKKNNEHCLKAAITITGVQNNFFIDKKDVIAILEKTNSGKLENTPVHEVDLASMEAALQKDQWIRKAELFFDNNNVLQVKISEREPVARIFTSSGSSFYMDSSLTRLPLSDKFSARLPVFTNFPTDFIVLSKKDSNLLKQIKILGEFIGNDPFWMAQIEQIDISPAYAFELIPKIGNQVIHFGNADNYRQKFRNLLTFYRQVETTSGWNMYSVIDVKFKGQVIGVKRVANEIKMDSLRAVQIMKAIIANAQKHTNDSTNIQLVQPADDNSYINTSPVIDNLPGEETFIKKEEKIKENNFTNFPLKKTATENKIQIHNSTLAPPLPSFKKPNPIPLKKSIIKPAASKPSQILKEQPKAVMPAKNDY